MNSCRTKAAIQPATSYCPGDSAAKGAIVRAGIYRFVWLRIPFTGELGDGVDAMPLHARTFRANLATRGDAPGAEPSAMGRLRSIPSEER